MDQKYDLGRAAPVWHPAPDYIRGSHVENVMHAMGIKLDMAAPGTAYGEFYRRSIAEPDAFWRATLDEIGVEWFEPYTASPTCRTGFNGRDGFRTVNSTLRTMRYFGT